MATSRRRLFERSHPEHALTAHKLALLPAIGELELCTAGQLAAFLGVSEKSVRDHTLDLFHHGLLERTAIPVLKGSSPHVHSLSRKGARLAEKRYVRPPGPTHLPHELQIRDLRVWLERLKRQHGHDGVSLWRTDLALGRSKPDAVFVYHLKGAKLTGMVEIDRGTERSPARWQDKFRRYAEIMAGSALKEATGQERGRVIVVAPTERRRDTIALVLAEMLRGERIQRERFWVTQQSTLGGRDLCAPLWRVPEQEGLLPLVPAAFV